MVYELWEGSESDDGTPSHLFVPADSPKHGYLTAGQNLIWTAEAPSWEEAMTKYHDYMGWDPYVPMPELGDS